MKLEIASNIKRQIIDMGKWFYIYIPFSKKEKEIFDSLPINPCWRIRQDKKKA